MVQKKADKSSQLYSKNAEIIERTLDAFGVHTRVVEIHTTKDTIQYCLEIVMGTSTAEIKSHASDLGLALASIDGTVDIQAPIPGRSLVGITMKKPTSMPATDKQPYKIIRTTEKVYVTLDGIERIREALAVFLIWLANFIIRISRKVDTKMNVEWEDNKSQNKQ